MKKIIMLLVALMIPFTLAGCDDAIDEYNDFTEEEFLADFVENVGFDLVNYGIVDDIIFPIPINSDMTIVIDSSDPEIINLDGHVTRPDDTLGDQFVTITIEYNYLEFSTTIDYQFQVLAIVEVRNIEGLEEIDYFIGEDTPDYLYGVSYFDNEYGDLSLHIEYDDQYVDYNVEGTYYVMYYVENALGYVVSNERVVNVELYFQGNETTDTFFIVRQDGLYGIINDNNTQVLDTKFDMIYGYENGYVVLKQGGNSYVYNLDSKESIFVEYDVVSGFHDGVAKVKIDNKYGFINIHGDLVIDAIYDYVSFGNSGQIIVIINNHYLIIDSDGNSLTTSDFESIVFMSDKGTYITKKAGLKGVMNSSLDQIIDNDYDYLYFQASTNTIVLTKDGVKGVADHDGNILCDVIYDLIVTTEDNDHYFLYQGDSFKVYDIRSNTLWDDDYYKYDKIDYGLYSLDENEDGSLKTVLNGYFNILANEVTSINAEDNGLFYIIIINYNEYRLFDADGVIVLSDNYKSISPVYGGFRHILNSSGMYRYISEDFTVYSDFSFTAAGGFTNGFAKVRYEGDSLTYSIDTTFTQIGEGYEYVKNHDELGNNVVISSGLAYLLDSSGNVLNDNDYVYIGSLFEGRYLVRGTNNLYGFINETGEEVIAPIYNAALNFSSGLSAVQNSEYKFGYIDTTGTLVIDHSFTNALSFQDDRAIVSNDSALIGFIDRTGTLVVDYLYISATDFYNDYSVVLKESDGLYYSIDKDGVPRNVEGYDTLTDYLYGISVFSTDGDYLGAYDEDFNEVVPEEFDTVIAINEKIVKVHLMLDPTRFSIYNIETQEISGSIYYEIGDMEYDMAYAVDIEGVTFINDDGEVIFDLHLEDTVDPFERIQQVFYQDEFMYLYRVNPDEIKLLQYYHSIGHFEIYKIVGENQFMIFDSNFDEVDGVLYDLIIPNLNEEFFTVIIGNNMGITNRDLETIVPIMYDEVFVDDDSETLVATMGLYTSIYDFNGEIMVGLEYEQIQIINK